MMRHTEGPWFVDPEKPGIVRFNDDPTSGILVGRLANSMLVASAPDLLALAVQYRDDLRHPPSADSRVRRIEAIDAALKKAGVQ